MKFDWIDSIERGVYSRISLKMNLEDDLKVDLLKMNLEDDLKVDLLKCDYWILIIMGNVES